VKYDALYVASHIPPGFISDGCSGAPDTIFGYDISPACRQHDASMCQRIWPAGSLDQDWRQAADRQLGVEIRSYLPHGLDWIGWVYWCAVHRFDGDAAFASCGPLEGDLCRHGQPRPGWMD